MLPMLPSATCATNATGATHATSATTNIYYCTMCYSNTIMMIMNCDFYIKGAIQVVHGSIFIRAKTMKVLNVRWVAL